MPVAIRSTGRILVGATVMFVVLQGGLNLLIPRLDITWSSLLVTTAMLLLAMVIERLAYGRSPRQAIAALGWGRPRPSALLAAAVIAAVMVAFFPVYSLVTGVPLGLKADWAWILLGAIALNGLAEETLFRGFVFGHLRQAGHTFRRAGAISLLIFGAVHLYLFTNNPPAIAFLATVLAVSAGLPLAFLFERAGMVIWAGVILHVTAHTFRLVDVPVAESMTLATAWLLLQFGAVFLVFVFRNNLLRSRPGATTGGLSADKPAVGQGAIGISATTRVP
jgi:membrane protease YdiL (CAAX protease family)